MMQLPGCERPQRLGCRSEIGMTDAIRGILGAGESPGINPSSGTKTGSAPGGSSSGPAVTDSAEIGQTQSLLETINATAGAVQDVNQSQVAEIRAAIANGTYQIDPQKIAKQLLNSDQVLRGATSGE